MEISNELLIDVALNVVGIVLAGLLLMVLHSMIGRKDRVFTISQPEAVNSNHASVPANGRTGAKIEFIDFQSKGTSANRPTVSNEIPAGQSSQFQRNRLEVIKQVREILNRGKKTQDIRRQRHIIGSHLKNLDQGLKTLTRRGAVNDH